MGNRFMPVPSSSANWRAKCVLPMPGGPSSSMGVTSRPSRLSCARATWRRTSSRASGEDWAAGHFSRPCRGHPCGLTTDALRARVRAIRSYMLRRNPVAPVSCNHASAFHIAGAEHAASSTRRAQVWGTKGYGWSWHAPAAGEWPHSSTQSGPISMQKLPGKPRCCAMKKTARGALLQATQRVAPNSGAQRLLEFARLTYISIQLMSEPPMNSPLT